MSGIEEGRLDKPMGEACLLLYFSSSALGPIPCLTRLTGAGSASNGFMTTGSDGSIMVIFSGFPQ